MKLTIAICTWNRARSLERTLNQIKYISLPNVAWELIVVNNNCTDDTERVLVSFAHYLPLRRVFEPEPGLSNARNAAIRNATGDYIIWTDDDVLVDKEWLVAYEQAFLQWPDAAIFGGPVYPKFEEPVPLWLQHGWHSVPSAFASVDFGSVPLPLSPSEGRLPYGANFAIRRAEQLKHAYDPNLGASPSGRYYAEETTLMGEILNSGAQGWWVPDASVQHCIPQDRMNLDYIRSYYEKLGRTQYFLSRRQTTNCEIRLLGRPRWLWRRIIEDELNYVTYRALFPPERWLSALKRLAITLGTFKESLN